MDDIELFKKTFFQECADLLANLEEQLTALQSGDRDPELVHESFRAIHSIKGGAGAFGFKRLIAYVHIMETVFDRIRSDKLGLSDELISSAVRASDVLADLVHSAETGEVLPENFETAAASDLAQAAGLDSRIGDARSSATLVTSTTGTSTTGTPILAPRGAMRLYSIEFRPKYDMLRRANEPILIVRQLKELGAVKSIVDTSALPPLDAVDPTDAYLAWTFEVETDAGLDAVQEVFEFVRRKRFHLQWWKMTGPLQTAAKRRHHVRYRPRPFGLNLSGSTGWSIWSVKSPSARPWYRSRSMMNWSKPIPGWCKSLQPCWRTRTTCRKA
jgi:two-component system chemotaxis sensor kinase CheA